jgi:hypothetical protein
VVERSGRALITTHAVRYGLTSRSQHGNEVSRGHSTVKGDVP